MGLMRAVVVDPEAVGRLSVAEVEEPEPAPSEALVRVAAVSLNRGEVRRAEMNDPGFRPGWDLAGTVERAAAARQKGPYHLILESVGGEVLGNALSMLAPEGTCVSFGVSGGTEVTFDARSFYLTGGTKLYGFILFNEVVAHPASEGLARLVRLVEEGVLNPRIEVEAPWTEVGEVAARLIDRGYTGKAVLRVGRT